MIIKNFQSLSTDTTKNCTLSILEAGLQASVPSYAIEKIVHKNYLNLAGRKIDLTRYRKIFIIAIGKGSYLMTKTVISHTHVDEGIIVVPKGANVQLKGKFKIIKSQHPIPNKNSIMAARQILNFLSKTHQDDFVIFLISGGASSLVALPDGISLREKQATNRVLLRSGVNIREINCIRKHLSQIKGGKMLNYLKSDAVSLVISDVVGDDLSSIASGITYFDKTTFRDARRIISKFSLEKDLPRNVLHHLDLGIKGKINETPKKGKIRNYLILTNNDCLTAMRKRSRDLGFSTSVFGSISGDVNRAAKHLAKKFSNKKMSCIIFGGEPTVSVSGKGKGGRNQELVLRIALNKNLQEKNVMIASIGTDGVDGNTNCAGALSYANIDQTRSRDFLSNNNTYHFFKKYGGLIFTGQTGTNLMDIGLILRR